MAELAAAAGAGAGGGHARFQRLAGAGAMMWRSEAAVRVHTRLLRPRNAGQRRVGRENSVAYRDGGPEPGAAAGAAAGGATRAAAWARAGAVMWQSEAAVRVHTRLLRSRNAGRRRVEREN